MKTIDSIEKICLHCKSVFTRKKRLSFKLWGKQKYCSAACSSKVHVGNKYNLGRKLSDGAKEKLSLFNKGKKLSDIHKEKISKARIGIKFSEEHRKKLSTSHFGYKYTDERKRKASEKMKRIGNKPPVRFGVENNMWKGGITPINQKIRKCLEYKLWRKSVFERDNYQCIWGGEEHGKELEADHIKPFSLYPELRFAIDNGRTLCKKCHRSTDTFGSKCKSIILQ